MQYNDAEQELAAIVSAIGGLAVGNTPLEKVHDLIETLRLAVRRATVADTAKTLGYVICNEVNQMTDEAAGWTSDLTKAYVYDTLLDAIRELDAVAGEIIRPVRGYLSDPVPPEDVLSALGQLEGDY